uniref:Uncharacterized protein n=1 Tax=Avena sativa TaxID=4498 RepID=A0ACD5U3H3_AVESA
MSPPSACMPTPTMGCGVNRVAAALLYPPTYSDVEAEWSTSLWYFASIKESEGDRVVFRDFIDNDEAKRLSDGDATVLVTALCRHGAEARGKGHAVGHRRHGRHLRPPASFPFSSRVCRVQPLAFSPPTQTHSTVSSHAAAGPKEVELRAAIDLEAMIEVLRVAGSPCRPKSARYAEKGYPNYAEEPDLCGPATPCRPRSARYAEKKGYRDDAERDVRAVSAAPCSPRSAPCTDKWNPIYAEPPYVCAPSAPCRPRSAQYAVKGYPDYPEPDVRATSAVPCSAWSAPCTDKGQPDDAESDRRRGHEWAEGGVPVNKPVLYYQRRKRRDAAKATEAAVAMVSPFLQGEEVMAQDRRKSRRTVGVPMSTDNTEVVPVDGGDDEHGGGEGGNKSWRLRVKETLRAFSSHYLHFVQEEQQREQAVRQELKASRALKRRANNQDDVGSEVKRPSKRPDLKALTKMQATNAILYPEKRIGHLPGVEVGDQFYSRAEMVVLGIHGHWMKGIDYVGSKYEDKVRLVEWIFKII